MPKLYPVKYVTKLGVQVVTVYPPSSSNGYVAMYIRPHPLITGVVVLRSRLRMTEKLGRKLKGSEIVHHKNEIRTDDRLRNLELTTRKKHNQHHRCGVRQSKEWVAKKVIGMRAAHKRGAFSHLSHAGESSARAKLKWKQAVQIRRLRAAGRTNREVAERFGVSVPTISMIHNKRIWRKAR